DEPPENLTAPRTHASASQPKNSCQSIASTLEVCDLSTSALWQFEDALADDVVLDFAGARSDGQATRGQDAMAPAAAFDCPNRTVLQDTEAAQQLIREHRNAEVQLGGKELAEGTFRAGDFAFQLRGERAIAAQAQAARIAPKTSQLLAHIRMFVCRN